MAQWPYMVATLVTWCSLGSLLEIVDNVSADSGPTLQHFGSGVYSAVNITDVVVRSILHYQRCIRDQNNPYGITLLDPLLFGMDHLAQRQTLHLNGMINGTVTGLSQFNITYVAVAMASNSVRLRMTLPQVNVSGSYNVSGTMASSLPLFGSGSYCGVFNNASVDMAAALGKYPTSGTLYMTDFMITFLTDTVQVTLGNLLGGGALGKLVQEFIQDSIQQFLQRARRQITDDLQNMAFITANSELEGMTIGDLIASLISFGNKTDIC